MQVVQITQRERRLIPQNYKTDSEKKGVLRWQNGALAPGVKVEGQKMTLDMNKLYPDDLLAIARDILRELSVPKSPFNEYNMAALDAVTQAINIMDLRAINKHGYSGSAEERQMAIPYDVDYLQFLVNMKKQNLESV